MARDILGFYYDEEKGKYFKIMPNHVAPEGVKYSRGGAKKEREREKKRKRDVDLEGREKRARVQRSRIMHHSLGAKTGLIREIGALCGRTSENAGRLWMQGIRQVKSLCFHETEAQLPFEIGLPPLNKLHVTAMVRDEATASILVGATATYEQECRGNPVLSWAPDRGDNRTVQYSPEGMVCLSHQNSNVTSLSISPARLLVSTTSGGANCTGSIIVTELVDAGVEDIWPLPVNGVTIVFRSSADLSSIWTSRPNPYHASMAFGTSGGIMVLTADHSTNLDWAKKVHKCESDIFALSWLSGDLLAGGSRDGRVMLYDQRSGGEAVRFKFPSAVNHLRKADDLRLVVAGLENNLHTYDLRYSNLPKGHSQSNTSTTPYISYPGYSNMEHITLGFDISPALGLVAAATEDKRIKVFELWTGQEAQAGWGIEKQWNEKVRCLSFVGEGELGNNQGPTSKFEKGLLVSNDGIVEEWGW